MRERKGFSYRYPETFDRWPDGYLAGNGNMGVIVFGNPLEETIIFNDRAFNMPGGEPRRFNQVSAETLEEIKSRCAAGDFAAANRLAVESAGYRDGGEGGRHPGYMMRISIPRGGAVRDYRRVCDFRTGEITVCWSDDRGAWQRRVFVSRPDNAAVQLLTRPAGGLLDCSIALSDHPGMHFPEGMVFENRSGPDFLVLSARYPSGSAGYVGVARVKISGGEGRIKDGVLEIRGADSVLLLTRSAKYNNNAGCGEEEACRAVEQALGEIPADYQYLLQRHIAQHGAVYDRVSVDFDASEDDRARPNEELLAMQRQSAEPVKALWERIFDAGRYYYLSSSSGATPPDLLGIWTGDCNVGWGGFYHLDANLNLQVAGGNIGDMPEAMEGYFHLNEAWANDFETNARKLLGCRGLLAAGNSPGLSSGLMASINSYYPYQYATGEEGWLLYPFWEHFLVTGDLEFLRNRLYPLLRKMGEFYEDFLTKTDENGRYILAGSVSPENQPEGLPVSLLNNSAFDIAGARFALGALLETCALLGLEQGKGEGAERWGEIYKKLPPYLVNEDGALKEWAWPGIGEHYNHRHSSHLLAVWPFREITPEKTPELYRAALAALEKRDAYNYENAGHGLLHAALIAACLKNARSLTAKLMRLTREDFYYESLSSSHYDGHKVFCTDVCNTVPAVMMEMLISTEPGMLELLPALPEPLVRGAITGVKGRSRLTVAELRWDMQAKIVRCTVRSDIDQTVTLIVRAGIRDIRTEADIAPSRLGGYARELGLKAGVPARLDILLQ